ncbi:MAG: 4'-phosphopantetheinyl transferase superfamily protein [Eubacteriaceae bacterium]|nr:4'-phosphopantetheinyl transferase superfamily protein [Eubacteriaceae bacterium]
MKIYLFDDMHNADINYLLNYIDKMPKQRAAQAQKYTHIRDKAICVLSFMLLKYGLNEIGLKTDNIEFIYKNNGKPYIKNENVFFNISHKDDVIICGLSDSECGADIEKIKPYKQNLAERICSSEELKLLSQCDNKEEEFARIWTIKESYLKYKGIGIAADLKSVEKNILKENLYIYSQKYDEYLISVCLPVKSEISIHKVSFE